MARDLTVFLVALMLASCQSRTGQQLTLSLQAVEPQIRVGTVPTFRFTVTNTSDHPSRILNVHEREDLQDTYYDLVVTKGGERVQIGRAISDPGPISDADWLEIPPGHTETFVLTTFPDAYETLPPDTYEAHVEFWRDPYNLATRVSSPTTKFIVLK